MNKPTASPHTLFISDLHLQLERPDITQAFLRFLQIQAVLADSLYILGDFFNLWIGDDDPNPFAQQISRALHQLSISGTTIFFVHGNRDFLIGDSFAKCSGINILPQPCVIQPYDEPILLLHGDSLCTQDTAYMTFREQVRSTSWQQAFLAKPVKEREQIAQQLRSRSQAMNSNKAEDIMDVTPEEVINLMTQHKVSTMIHGHTHRPQIHTLLLSGVPARRVVLGDWDKKLWYVELNKQQLTLQSADIEEE